MIIVKIEAVNKKKSRVITDEQLTFVLYKSELFRYGLKEETELTEDVYETILNETLIKRAKSRSMYLLLSKDRTRAELFKKLKDDGYPFDAIEAAVSYVEGYGYIDDKRYTENYIRVMGNKKSGMVLRMELKKKGIDEELIEEALADRDENLEYEVMSELLRKRGGEPHKLEDKEKNRLFGYLMRRGFPMSGIKKVIREYEDISRM